MLYEHEWEPPRLHWLADKRRFAYEQVDRGHQRLRVIAVDSHTGEARNLVDEKTQTFIWTAHNEMLNVNYINWLDKSDEMIYVSERDGWRHLYLIDTKDGTIKNQITKGPWVVRGIDHIDEDRAAGVVPRRRHELRAGPVFHSLLPHQFRRHGLDRAHGRGRQSHRAIFRRPEVFD